MADADCDTPASIVFESGYPLQFTEKEGQLTESRMEETCKKYMNELGITEEPDHLELEFFG